MVWAEPQGFLNFQLLNLIFFLFFFLIFLNFSENFLKNFLNFSMKILTDLQKRAKQCKHDFQPRYPGYLNVKGP